MPSHFLRMVNRNHQSQPLVYFHIFTIVLLLGPKFCSGQTTTPWTTVENTNFKSTEILWPTINSNNTVISHYPSTGFYSVKYNKKGYNTRATVSLPEGYENGYACKFTIRNRLGEFGTKVECTETIGSPPRTREISVKETNPPYGIVYGFKDWQNYNYVRLQNKAIFVPYQGRQKRTEVTAGQVRNGDHQTLKTENFACLNDDWVELNIQKKPGQFYIGTKNSTFINTSMSGPDIVGHEFGILIGAGAEVEVKEMIVWKWTHPHIQISEASFKNEWNEQDRYLIEGVYEGISTPYRIAIAKAKQGDFFDVIYLSGGSSLWDTGDIKARLKPTASSEVWHSDYYMGNKSLRDDLLWIHNPPLLSTTIDGTEVGYLKVFPNSMSSQATSTEASDVQAPASSGSGIIISPAGYVLTNAHVVEDAKKIIVSYTDGETKRDYTANIIQKDSPNDLALLKLEITGSFGTPPFGMCTTQLNLGEKVFGMGYPLVNTMGKQIKLTFGQVTARSGFDGDIRHNQIDAALQPGNSGGPVFNEEGCLVGLCVAKHVGAENVSYMIKATQLTAFLASAGIDMPEKKVDTNIENTIKSLERWTALITCY